MWELAIRNVEGFMELTEARRILGSMSAAIQVEQWSQELTTAIQRALAELQILNPYDDVDGLIGSRTQGAWKFF